MKRKIKTRAAAIDTDDAREVIDEPIQCRIEMGWVKFCRCAQEEEVTVQFSERVGHKERVR